MKEIDIVYKGKKITTVEKELNIALEKSINYLATEVWKEAINNAPRVTGTLKRSIRIIPVDSLTKKISTGIRYAIFVEEGTRPHIIKPRRAKALHWIVNKTHYFSKLVRHPGTKGQYFMKRAMEHGEEKADEIFRKHIEFVLQK